MSSPRVFLIPICNQCGRAYCESVSHDTMYGSSIVRTVEATVLTEVEHERDRALADMARLQARAAEATKIIRRSRRKLASWLGPNA